VTTNIEKNGKGKKWKGGGEGNDVKWFPININEIENEWKLHSMR